MDPKLIFSCISFRLGAFGTVSLPHKTQSKTGQTGVINAKVRATRSCWNFRNERSRSTPLDPKLMFWCVFSVWVLLEPFCYCTKLAAKRTKPVQLMQKFVPRCLVRIFCNECSRSTPLDPKPMFWCVSFYSGAFWNNFATARNWVQNTPNWCN